MAGRAAVAGHVLAGGGLGVCVGLLLGMTTTPVVGTVIGALAALFATVFGARPAADGAAQPATDYSAFARVGAFGAMCAAGVLAGVTVRAHNLLGLTVKQQVAQWTDAGFAPELAQRLVMYRALGLSVDTAGVLRADTGRRGPNPLESTLSGAGTAEGECARADPARFGDEPAKITASYRALGGRWAELAAAADSAPPQERLRLLRAAWRLTCGAR